MSRNQCVVLSIVNIITWMWVDFFYFLLIRELLKDFKEVLGHHQILNSKRLVDLIYGIRNKLVHRYKAMWHQKWAFEDIGLWSWNWRNGKWTEKYVFLTQLVCIVCEWNQWGKRMMMMSLFFKTGTLKPLFTKYFNSQVNLLIK